MLQKSETKWTDGRNERNPSVIFQLCGKKQERNSKLTGAEVAALYLTTDLKLQTHKKGTECARMQPFKAAEPYTRLKMIPPAPPSPVYFFHMCVRVYGVSA